ncbi:MAG: hybrid sensor histidine kinase/response regulator [Proteobacteria bacterium]|nr:hybrid sensor histidine kinase/response regulator [Pseudomonadota bacterium]
MKFDDELIQIFIEEANDILEAINKHLENWQSNKAQLHLLDPILREIHTLKGSARMIGLTALSEYVHCLEQIIQKIHSSELSATETVLQEIQRAIDFLNEFTDKLAKSSIIPDNEIPLAALRKCLSNEPDTIKKEETDQHEKASLQDHSKVNQQEQAITEVIRIKTDVLERFSKLAGQINIARSHLAQQMGKARESLAEMTKEIKLIQEQMRYLQVKADTNLRMYQSVMNEKGYDDFDILEFDRYSFLQQSTRLLVDKLNYVEELSNNVSLSARGFESLLVEQGRAARSLEEGITHARMISLESLVPRLKRIVRQVSHELGKEAHLICVKAQGEVDRKILERLIPGLEHMVRNAIDHGIESKEQRKNLGKPDYGVITISMQRQGNEIIIELSDDGQGIDIDKIRTKAIEKNLWSAKTIMTLDDAIRVISLPGFSTKEVVTPISGRGLGMDVVNAEINKLGGMLQVSSRPSVGTFFTIRLPFSLSMSQALILNVGEQTYAIPLAHLAGITRVSQVEIKEKFIYGSAQINYAHSTYDLFYLAQMLGEKQQQVNQQDDYLLPVIFLQSDREKIAFVIDKLIGSREIVIKPAGLQLQFVKEISGVSLLGDGQIVLVLNAQYLIQCAWAKMGRQQITTPIKEFEKQAPCKVMIVDDSTTVRQVTSRFLKRHGFKPLTAIDGVDAFEIMEQELPDIVLLDIEMPRMDGFQVVEKMKQSTLFKNIPVIMITSRSGEKHRERAMKAGADAYLTKPYLEDELLQLLQQYREQGSAHESR